MNTPITALRKYNLTSELPIDPNAFQKGAALASMIQGRKKEAQQTQMQQDAGMLAQLLRTRGDDDYLALIDQFSRNPDVADDMAYLGSLSREEGLAVAESMLRGNGFESFIPAKPKPGVTKVAPGERLVDSSGNVVFGGEGEYIDPDFIKEERKIASSSLSNYKKRAMEINSSFGKLQGMVEQAKSGGGRGAMAAAIMNLARLISPGVVTNQDFQSLSGAADPVALAFSMISGKDENVAKQLQLYYDPSNPQLNDPDNLLKVGKAVIASEAPGILRGYEESKERAKRAGLNERQLNTIFGDDETIIGLKKYVNPEGVSDFRSKFDGLPKEEKLKFLQKATPEQIEKLGLL